MYIVNIITKGEAGLAVDAAVIASELAFPEFMVHTAYVDKSLPCRILHRQKIRWMKWRFKNRPVINLHCEQIAERFLALGDFNVLIPNQEWVWPRTQQLIHKVDAIFCKSRYATKLYQQYGNALFIGFSSQDRADISVNKDYRQFLHLGGKSAQKGSRSLARVWSRHPEWPILNIVTRRQGLLDDIEAANINKINTLSPEHLQELQNRCGVHVCPSEAEGYGHSIGEGMSTGAVMVTTDAPPMHELVERSRGILVPFDRQREQGLGANYYVDENALELAILQIIAIPHDEKALMSHAARQWFVENRENFATGLRNALKTLATQPLSTIRSNRNGQALNSNARVSKEDC